jgi:hypothetical protein
MVGSRENHVTFHVKSRFFAFFLLRMLCYELNSTTMLWAVSVGFEWCVCSLFEGSVGYTVAVYSSSMVSVALSKCQKG